MTARRRGARRRRLRRRHRRAVAAATGRTAGASPSGWSRSAASPSRRRTSSSRTPTRRRWTRSSRPLRMPDLPLAACAGVLVAAAARVARAAGAAGQYAGPRDRPPRCADPPRWRHDPVRARHGHLSRRGRAGAGRRRPHDPRGRAVPGRRPHRLGQVDAAGASTGWSRTSPAARSPAGSSSTAATPEHHRPRDLADVVGFVGQDPLAGFVTDTVEDELAYGMESLGVAPGDDAPAGRGDARPARPRRAARPAAARRCPAGSSSGSRSASVLTAAPAGAGARRADVARSTRPPPRRCWPPCTGWCTTSA